MFTRMKMIGRTYNGNVLAVISGLALAGVLIAADGPATQDEHSHAVAHDSAAPAKLVQVVRDATKQFIDVNAARAAGYGPFLGCVTGPDQGAMGVHYVNGTLVGDGEVDAAHPEALIYEPSADGLRLVGVEYIVDAANVGAGPQRSAGSGRSGISIGEQSESIWVAGVLRAARLGVAG